MHQTHAGDDRDHVGWNVYDTGRRAVAGRHKKKAAEEQAAQQGAAQAEAQAAGSLTTFGKAMSSCLEGKGYTVN